MRAPQRNRYGSLGFNMTPMIDVVFQLIIFFLVSSHLAKQEAQLQLPLPVADSGQAEDADQPRAVINVLADGRLLMSGRAIEVDELERRLRSLLDEKGSLEVKLRADRHVAYRHVEPIMLACRRAGVGQVTFSVYRSQDVR